VSSFGARGILLLLAVICFVVACFGLAAPVNLTALGLAFFAAAFLVGDR
jgi:hypothetical protein